MLPFIQEPLLWFLIGILSGLFLSKKIEREKLIGYYSQGCRDTLQQIQEQINEHKSKGD